MSVKYKQFCFLLLSGFIIWLIPLLVSFGMYNQNGQLMVDYWIFKVVMVLVATITSVFTLRRYYKHFKSDWKFNSIVILGVNVLLDLIVLVGVLKMDWLFYLYSVVPVYILFISLTNFLISKQFRS